MTTNPTNEIELTGDLSVAGAASILQQLRQGFKDRSNILIRFGDVSAADLSFIQLLASAQWTAKESGISFGLTGSIPEILQHIARESATENIINELLLT